MPTIELISVDCVCVPELPTYESFAHIAETELIGHRGLFQSVFDSITGIILHLANKDLEGKDGGYWFAGQIVDWPDSDALKFLPETSRDIFDLMKRLIAASPKQQIIFSTDYQFGGDRQECGHVTLGEFFKLHDQDKLQYNQLWYIDEAG